MTRYHQRIVLALAALITTAGCKGFLDVTNPGPILDSNLFTPEAVPALVVGMSADLSRSQVELVRFSAVTGDELTHGGSYTQEGLWWRGIIRPEDVNTNWSLMHTARFEAESGVDRMKTITGFDYERSAYAARANMLAGFANRTLGEFACHAVINNGPAQDRKVHFQRAEKYFTEAIRIAPQAAVLAAPNDPAGLLSASYAGRASVRAWQGNWADAVIDAAKVPASFSYTAIYSKNSTRENNSLVQETYVRREFTVFSTQWAAVFRDSRVPWDTIKTSSGGIQTGQDGSTPFFRQKKYTDLGSAIPLVKGTEMLLLRAEAELRAGNVAAAFALINEARASASLPALAAPPDLAAAWKTLQVERGAVVWLEARRLWDLQRWNAATGPARNAFLDTRDKCLPVSRSEQQTNPNLTGALPPVAPPVP